MDHVAETNYQSTFDNQEPHPHYLFSLRILVTLPGLSSVHPPAYLRSLVATPRPCPSLMLQSYTFHSPETLLQCLGKQPITMLKQTPTYSSYVQLAIL